MSTISRTPSLTPSRSPSPTPPIQPDHFYGPENVQLPPSPNSDGKTWLDPEDDPLAHRGIPVFKPTMDEFEDFEAFISKVECWGSRSGIIKVIPPQEWTDALPPLQEKLKVVKIKSPIEQHMLGHGGLFRQENVEKRRILSVREWAELCRKDEHKAPGIDEVGLRSAVSKPKPTRRAKRRGKAGSTEADNEGSSIRVKQEPDEEDQSMEPSREDNSQILAVSPPNSSDELLAPLNHDVTADDRAEAETHDSKGPSKNKRAAQTREAREASLTERAVRDNEFLKNFDPHNDWLPPNTKPSDYTPEFCQKLERQYWRNCGLSKPAWYGADTQGSLYTDQTTCWNVAHLPSTLSRILPASSKGLPGVNTPYLYFGMWRATFAWHVEDMDLFSINYIHFGAPKFWYAVPQGRAGALEQTMRGYFPKDTNQCPQFLRHKSFLASPNVLAQSSCRPNILVQRSGEFVITFPRGYHAGFNLGFNCAESVNFALDSWLELGRRAKVCMCISDSVTIDVDQLLEDRQREILREAQPSKPQSGLDGLGKAASPRKRKAEGLNGNSKRKKIKIKPTASGSLTTSPMKSKIMLTLKLGKPAEPEIFPCCLCTSKSEQGLLPVSDPPLGRKDAEEAAGNPKKWMAHEECANIVPETWVDEVDSDALHTDGSRLKERVVFGVDGVVKDRWNLKCSACTKPRNKAHGAPIQCTKGKCSKAFHVSCAREGTNLGIVFTALREVEKEVVLLDPCAQDKPQSYKDKTDQVDDGPNANPDRDTDVGDPRFLKVIRKIEVQVLCSQHNPVVAAAKKASKQDKIRNDLLALPTMARIKIRVSAGVFEVSLIRVIEDTGSVEVLWDRGVKREFKWGSVVFGSIDGQTVVKKPTEAEPEQRFFKAPNPLPVTSSPLSAAASGPSMIPPGPRCTTQRAPFTMPTHHPYPHANLVPNDRSTLNCQQQRAQDVPASHFQPYAQIPQAFPHGYYRQAPPGTAPAYPYGNYTPTANQYRAQLQWQQPYTGPRRGYASDHYPSQSATQIRHNSTERHFSTPAFAVDGGEIASVASNDAGQSSHPISTTQSNAGDSSPSSTLVATSSQEMGTSMREINTLSALQPSQIAEVLRSNPDLRDAVWAAVDKHKMVKS